MGDGDVVLTGQGKTEVVIPKGDADVVLGEPWNSEDEVVAGEGGGLIFHHFHVAEHIHDYLGGVVYRAHLDEAAVNDHHFVGVFHRVKGDAGSYGDASVYKTCCGTKVDESMGGHVLGAVAYGAGYYQVFTVNGGTACQGFAVSWGTCPASAKELCLGVEVPLAVDVDRSMVLADEASLEGIS